MKAKRSNLFIRIGIAMILYGLAIFLFLPIIIIISGSIMSNFELSRHLMPITAETEEFISWNLIADYPNLMHYLKLLFYTPSFFVVFWNSIKIVFCILAGQMLIALPAAWAFAVYPFRMRNALFSLYVVLMLMPFQVMMLSNYLVLDFIGIINTHTSVILPAVFSAFPVFIMYRGFREIPPNMLEAARMDGAGEIRIFFQIGLPIGSTGILSAVVLGFLEYWSMIEQPLTFLKEKSLWPLSLFLPEIGLTQAGYAFAASVITLIPAAFVFALGQEYLEQGIVSSSLKE